MSETNGKATFNPSEHISDLRGKQYLEVKWRLAWLRADWADAKIVTNLERHDLDASFALFKAEVVLPSGGSATGWGSETESDFGDYIEKAETKALGRALAALGFGTQFCDDFGSAPARVENAPVPPPAPKRASAAIGDKPDPVTEAWTHLATLYPGYTPAARSARLDHIAGRFPDIVSGESESRQADFTLLSKDELTGFVSDLKAIAQPAE